MEENFKNKLGLFLFIFIILFLLIGGYFFQDYVLNDHTKKEESAKSNRNYKIDKKKDYIYYENEGYISEEAEIEYKDIVINIEGQEVLSETLNKESKMFKDNIQYITDHPELIEDAIHYRYDNIYSVKFKNYKNYEHGKYVSLIVDDFKYDCIDNVQILSTKTYVFDVKEGTEVDPVNLMGEFEITEEDIKNSVREYLIQKNSAEEKQTEYKIDETINGLDFNNLIVNEFGKLSISYIVKTSDTDYNEVTEV